MPYRLLFTGCKPNLEQEKVLRSLNAQIVNVPRDCTHCIALGIVRTEKFLMCVALGRKILDFAWVEATRKRRAFPGMCHL
jgi:hypothetical protein